MSKAARIYLTADCGCRFRIMSRSATNGKSLDRVLTCENHMGDPW